MSDLNLLPSEAKFQAERMHYKKMISAFMWFLGGAWLLLVVIVLVINLIKQLNVNQLKDKLQKSVDQYKNLAGDLLINQKVKQQAKIVAMVLQQRFEFGNSMEKIKNIFTENINIDTYKHDGVRTYIIEGTVPEPKNFDEVELRVDDINLGKIDGFKSAKIESIKINKAKGWDFTLEITLL